MPKTVAKRKYATKYVVIEESIPHVVIVHKSGTQIRVNTTDLLLKFETVKEREEILRVLRLLMEKKLHPAED